MNDDNSITFNPVARFRSPLTSKFGLPRQSGLAGSLDGRVVFEPRFRSPEGLRGIEGFDYLWLIWVFSANRHSSEAMTVRPPRLGGNTRLGVWATRSPYRPNPVGLSCVKLERVEWESDDGPVLHVSGADLMDGTPIIDIKPYVPYCDAHPGARGGFTDDTEWTNLDVVIAPEVEALFDKRQLDALRQLLALDPRPHYHNDPDRVYGIDYAGHNLHFRVTANTLHCFV